MWISMDINNLVSNFLFNDYLQFVVAATHNNYLENGYKQKS